MPDTNQTAMPETTSSTTRSKGRTTESASSGRTEGPQRLVHLVLQGKGGVGKTIAALFLSQAIAERGEPVVCIDTDPVNASLSSLSSLDTERISIFVGKKIDTHALDLFTERLVSEDANFVIDNGASSFVPVSQYLLENDVTRILHEEGRQPVVHCVVTGGPMMLDTIKGLASILEKFPPAVRIVVWVNEYFGPVVNAKGVSFEELPIYTDNRERIAGLVRLPQFDEDYADTLRAMLSQKVPFAEALKKENTAILRAQKARLSRIKDAIWPQIEAVI